MHTKGKLNSGEELDYAFALGIGKYKGLKTVSHGGALGGYRSALMRFPEQNFSVICLSNLSSFNPTRLSRIFTSRTNSLKKRQSLKRSQQKRSNSLRSQRKSYKKKSELT
jgi:hypothetical protein